MNYKNIILCSIMGICASLITIATLNFIIDPFGVFGDRFINWYGYNMTNNPRLAKFAYLDKNYKNYNAYILGSSKASSISPKQLNKYYDDAKFFNLMMYGANLDHMNKTLRYVIDNYDAEHIVLCLGISELLNYGSNDTDVKQEFHAKPAQKSLYAFYLKYLYLTPKYAITKVIESLAAPKRGYLSSDVFIADTGVYNKVYRDEENILNVGEYKENIGEGSFLTPVSKSGTIDLDIALNTIKEMKSYADLKNVSLLIISTPTYDTETLSIDPDILDEYWKNIANISDYYNFSGTTDIGNDPRYFYDSIHFRNIAGEMLLAFIFKDDEYYYPKNLGYFVNKNNVSDINRKLLNLTEHDHIEKVRLPIIMYHHISDHDNANEVIISKDDFKNHMIAIKQAGFTAISTQELISFANEGKDLPDKPILITFDDGYKSNYDLAYPILKELGIKSSINVIVSCMGLDKLDNSEIIPHFSIEEANEMIQSGLIDIQNHSYNLHSNESSNLYRKGIMPMPKESIKQYIDTLKQDNNLAKGIESKLINKFEVFSYPYGFANLTADTLLKELGYKMTLLTGNKINYVYKNDPISIFGLYRLNINGKMSSKQLIELIEENG